MKKQVDFTEEIETVEIPDEGPTQETIIRKYANGVAEAFINELNAGHIPGEAPGKHPANVFSLVEAFIHYINRASVRS